MVSCQKCPTRHAYAWQIGTFWQDTLNILSSEFQCTDIAAYSSAVDWWQLQEMQCHQSVQILI